MLQKIIEYWQAAAAAAKGSIVTQPFAFCRITLCRLIFGFGPKDYLLFNFHSKPFFAPKSYLKKEPLEAMQRAVNLVAGRRLVDDKLVYFYHCKEHHLPTPEVLAVAGTATDTATALQNGVPFLACIKDLMAVLSHQVNGYFLFKPSDGSHGKGIVRFELSGGSLLIDSGKLTDTCESTDAGELIGNSKIYSDHTELKKILEGDSCYILQKSLIPHPDLRPIMPHLSLGTLRLVTVTEKNNIRLVYGCLKIPMNKNISDNFCTGSSGNLVAHIDLSSGKLLKVYGPDTQYSGRIKEIARHPDTDISFTEFVFPHWNSILETVKVGSRAFNTLQTIGWDVALTENGPCLIEANYRYDCDLLQVTLDRGLKTEFQMLLQPLVQ